MRTIRLTLDKGLSLGTPPSDLVPGELTLARNCYYQPEDDALYKINGRTDFGTITAATATGLSFVSFRTAGSFLIGTAGTTLATAPVGDTGTFTSRHTYGTTSGKMEAVYYNGTDRAYIFDGVNRAQVWSGTGNTRDLGLDSPTTAPTVAEVANSTTTYSADSIFSYCFTEYDSVNDVESGPSPVSEIQISTTESTIKITLPAQVNASADSYRIYRTQSEGAVFFRLAEVLEAITEYYDGDNTDGAAANRQENQDFWGFISVTDIFLANQPTLPMLGQPISGNYITVNGEPPIGDIAVIFENSLCVSGITAFPQDIYYSQPDSPEQFSPIYFLREENERGDKVTGLGVANDRLIAFTLNSIFRHDTLPRITDPGFGLGLASRQLVTSDHGCVAKRSVVNFGVGAPNNRLFYLSTRGPFMTDGYQTIPLGEDLDWSDRVINFDAISSAVAKNYQKYFQIWLFLPSPGSSTNDIAFIYHYHPRHAKENGIGKWTGPIDVRCAAAAVAYESNSENRMFISDSNTSGKVYLEDSGLSDAQDYLNSDNKISWEWATGDHDFGVKSLNKKAKRIFMDYVGTDSFEPTFSCAINQNDSEFLVPLANLTTNVAGFERYGTTYNIQKVKGRRIRGGVWQVGTHFRFHMQELAANQARAISSIELELEPYGTQR